MDKRYNDNRTFEEIRAGWKKNGFVIGKLMSESETSEAQKQIEKVNEKIHLKKRKRLDKEYKDKPVFLISCAGFLEKILHITVTLFTMAIVVNIFFGYQIYKTVSAVGWQGIFQTKYTLYILAYFMLLFSLKKVYFLLYKYAHE